MSCFCAEIKSLQVIQHGCNSNILLNVAFSNFWRLMHRVFLKMCLPWVSQLYSSATLYICSTPHLTEVIFQRRQPGTVLYTLTCSLKMNRCARVINKKLSDSNLRRWLCTNMNSSLDISFVIQSRWLLLIYISFCSTNLSFSLLNSWSQDSDGWSNGQVARSSS